VGGSSRGDELMGYALVHWGDFNVTLFHSDRSGGARMRHVVSASAQFTVDQGCMDLPLAGWGVYVV
jgi:hypothetical protein